MPDFSSAIAICASDTLQEGGKGVRFTVTRQGRELPAFVVRFDGAARAFINQCAHVPMELDWAQGTFFDADGLTIMCSTHGAMYDPVTGRCVAGPCRGASLQPAAVVERDALIWFGPVYDR